jgi:hypothetical protein
MFIGYVIVGIDKNYGNDIFALVDHGTGGHPYWSPQMNTTGIHSTCPNIEEMFQGCDYMYEKVSGIGIGIAEVEYKIDKFIPVSELKQVITINQKKRRAIQVQIEQLQRELDEI